MDFLALMTDITREKLAHVQAKEEPDPELCIVCQLEPSHPEFEDDTCGSLACRDIWLEELWGRR